MVLLVEYFDAATGSVDRFQVGRSDSFPTKSTRAGSRAHDGHARCVGVSEQMTRPPLDANESVQRDAI